MVGRMFFLLIFIKIYDIIFIEKLRKEQIKMTLEVLKALAIILEFCLNQDSCKDCPMSQFCGKMPSEW